MFIKATLLLLLGAAHAQDEVRSQHATQLFEPLDNTSWRDYTCHASQVFSKLTGTCIDRSALASSPSIKPSCHVQKRWSISKQKCVRSCDFGRYFYPSTSADKEGRCFD
jgi:hypothetical protein